MLYPDFIHQAIDLTIVEADNGLSYLDPMWKSILYDNKLDIKRISSFKTTWDEVFSVLKLEVERRNAVNSKMPEVIKWLYDLIYTQLEPAILDQETDLMKEMLERMNAKTESHE